MPNRPSPKLSPKNVCLTLLLAASLATLAACGNASPTATTTVPATASPTATTPPTATVAATPTTPATATATRTANATPAGLPAGTPIATPASTPAGGAMDYPDVIKLAIKHLATDVNVPEAHIQVITYEETEWSDSSLGCPKPGMSYLTVITPGYRVVLKAGGLQYEYHTNLKGMVVRCTK
jgi:hypothetical protein